MHIINNPQHSLWVMDKWSPRGIGHRFFAIDLTYLLLRVNREVYFLLIIETIKASNAIKNVPNENRTTKLSYILIGITPFMRGLADLSLKEHYPTKLYHNSTYTRTYIL